MRKAPLVAVGSACVLVLAATVTLHAAYWSMTALVGGGPLGFGYFNASALQHGTGYLHIAYSNGDKDDVLLRWWDGNAWQVQTVDAGRDVARGIDLAFNAVNQPAVSYAGGAVKFAERSGTSTWTVKSIESGARNDVTSLTFQDGQPAISYYLTTTPKKGPAVSTLKLARRSGTTWTKTTVAPGVRYSSLAFDATGQPAIAYAGDINGDTFADSLRLARFNGSAWTWESIDNSSGAGTWARLGFAPDGYPFVVDSPSSTGLVRFWYQDASGWHSQDIGSGYRPALLVHNGSPIVSYASPDGYAVMVATRSASGVWTSVPAAGVLGLGYVGQSSLAVPYGTGGQPAVAYCVEVYGINASRTLWLAGPTGY